MDDDDDPGDGCHLCVRRKSPPDAPPAVARVEITDEAAALREALARQHEAIAALQAELDAERGAAAGAASEAMTMILRLQREKAEAMMEARQFRRYAEEKMSHDAAELAALEALLAHRDNNDNCGYPPLRCADHPPTASEADALEALDVQTPRDHFNRLARRVHLLERMPSRAADMGVVGVAPISDSDDAYSLDFFPLAVDRYGAAEASDLDAMSDRVYTIDAVHAAPDGCCGTPTGSDACGGGGADAAPWVEEEEIWGLSARLRALEADRESMRQAIISMGAEKAQAVLLREIAQQLCKEAAPAAAVVQRRVVAKKQPSFLVATMLKVNSCALVQSQMLTCSS